MSKSQKKKDQELEQIQRLAVAVGNFIRYWGFRRIHGQIWTAIYLSQTELSGSDLVKALGVSKALVSPALAELEGFGLIRYASGDAKTKRYEACPDVFSVIQRILRQREKRLILEAKFEYEVLLRLVRKGATRADAERLDKVGKMIHSASMAIELILASATSEDFSLLGGFARG